MRLRSFFIGGLTPLAVALLPALCAAAEDTTVTYLAPGVSLEKITDSTRFYDVGKGAYYWYSHLSTTEELYNRTGDFSFMGRLGERYVKQPEFNPDAFKGLINDNFTSWYNAGSNAIQYWQDCYAPFFKRWDQRRDLPQGLTYDKNNLEALGGTQSLEVNMKFYDSWSDVEKGVTNAFEWYLSGNDRPAGGGYFREYYNGIETSKECSVYASQGVVDMDKVTSGIFESFGLERQEGGTLQLVDQGLIPTLSASDSLTDCALTCYGFTLGADGLVNSLYIADSGDAQYRIEHIYLKVVEDSKGNEHLLIFTDEACTKAWHSDGFSKWGLTGICHINTPDELKELYNTLHNPATPMEWTGETEYWSTDTTLGWNVEIKGETYTSGYENGHPVLFTDAAYEFRNYVKGDVNTPLMEVVNDEYDYRFLLKKNEEKGTLEPGTLKIGTLDKSGKGELRFINVPLTVDTWQVREGSVIIEGTSADIANATIDGTLAIVGENCKLTLGSGISGSGAIILGDKTSLDLGNQAISLSVTLQGSGATIENGTVSGKLTLDDDADFTWGNDGLQLTGNVSLGHNAAFNLGDHTLSQSVTLQGSNASITNGIITGDLILADNVSYTWSKDAGLQLQGNIILGDGATFNFGGETFSNPFTMQGSATIGNGTFDGSLTVAGGWRMTLLPETTVTGGVTLENESTLDLGGGTYDTSAFTFEGSATIGHGKLEGSLAVAAGKRLTLLADTTITGGATLGNESTLDLGGGTYDTSAFTFEGNATIGNGTLAGSLAVAAGKYLALLENTTIMGSVTLNDGATFDMGGNSFHIGGADGNKVVLNGNATIGHGTLDGVLSVAEFKRMTLLAGTTITGGITLANGAALDMGGNTFYTTAGAAENKLVLSGHATIGNGVLEGDLTVAASKHLSLNGDLSGSGTFTLKDKAVLNLGGHALSHSVSISQSEISAEIHNGTLNGDVTVGKRTTLRLNGTISGEGTISLGDKAVLDLVGCTGLSNSVSLDGSEASIQGNGLNGEVTVGEGKTLNLSRGNLSGTGAISLGGNAKLHLSGNTYSGSVYMGKDALITLDEYANTAIKTREDEDHAVLEKVSVSAGLIAGTDSSASLVDGVYIDHKGYDLTLKDLTLTDNNSIWVGENKTITLNQVTIKPSEGLFGRENPQDGVYYFDMTDLFHCYVDMNDMVFDASELALPLGFDLETGGIGFNFGEAVSKDQATKLTLLMGGYGSETVDIDEQGTHVVFRNLVRIPEPATGTLSLLALAALAARRRK